MSSPPEPSPSAPALPCALPPDMERWFKDEIELHEPVLRVYLRRRFPRLSDVDDVVQESYLRLLRARAAGTLKSAKGFLFTAARNVALDLFRHRAVVRIDPLTEETASALLSEGRNAAEAASLNQELEMLTAAMRDLPDRCRQILLLRRIHGLSHQEIARQLSISEHTVEKQVGIGLRKCVAYLQNRGFGPAKKP